MSTSHNRRQKREMMRLDKMPVWKVVKKFKNVVGKDIKVVKDEKPSTTYQEFIDNLEITPEMLKELEEHDLALRNDKKDIY